MLDRLSRIADGLSRLGKNVDQSFVLRTFVRQLPSECSFVKQLLEGKDIDREEILKRVKARYSSLKGHSKDHGFVSQGRPSKKDGDRIGRYSCRGLACQQRAS